MFVSIVRYLFLVGLLEENSTIYFLNGSTGLKAKPGWIILSEWLNSATLTYFGFWKQLLQSFTGTRSSHMPGSPTIDRSMIYDNESEWYVFPERNPYMLGQCFCKQTAGWKKWLVVGITLPRFPNVLEFVYLSCVPRCGISGPTFVAISTCLQVICTNIWSSNSYESPQLQYIVCIPWKFPCGNLYGIRIVSQTHRNPWT